MVAVTAGGWLMWSVCAVAAAGVSEQTADVASAEPVAPSMEMLLYLAEFEDREGQWVDPMAVAGQGEPTAAQVGSAPRPLDPPSDAADERTETPR